MIPVASVEYSNSHHSSDRSACHVTRFESEKELVRYAVTQSKWQDLGCPRNAGVTTELESPTGIIDIAFFRLRKDWRQHAVVGRIPSRWAYAFHKIPYRLKFTTDDLAVLSGTSLRRAKLALLDFSTFGLCRMTADKQYWIKLRQPLLAIRELISVEAKLRDWRRALDQAARHLAYSDRAWVLLDDHSIGAAKENLQEFVVRSVGLASISKTGTVTGHFSPDKSQLIRPHDRWVVNSELLKHVHYAR